MVSSTDEYILQILKSKNLSITPCRLAILKLFSNKTAAISSSNIEESVKSGFDRVTIYRTLKSFLEIGIIHKIPDDNGEIKYALCREDHCPDHVHVHEHLHFKCIQCSETSCLAEIKVPKINVPDCYTIMTTNILVQGICKNCSC